MIQRIAVYCGASKGLDETYVKEAYALGQYFAEQGIELVFGAGSVGIMGAIQDGVLDHGGHAIGVMPRLLDEREITSQKVSELILVDSMHERKQKWQTSPMHLSLLQVVRVPLKNFSKFIVGHKLDCTKSLSVFLILNNFTNL